MASNIIAILST